MQLKLKFLFACFVCLCCFYSCSKTESSDREHREISSDDGKRGLILIDEEFYQLVSDSNPDSAMVVTLASLVSSLYPESDTTTIAEAVKDYTRQTKKENERPCVLTF